MSRIPVHRSNNPSTRCCIAEFRGGSIPVFRDNVTKKSRNAYGIAFVDRFSRYPRSDSPRRRSALPASRIPVVIVDGWSLIESIGTAMIVDAPRSGKNIKVCALGRDESTRWSPYRLEEVTGRFWGPSVLVHDWFFSFSFGLWPLPCWLHSTKETETRIPVSANIRRSRVSRVFEIEEERRARREREREGKSAARCWRDSSRDATATAGCLLSKGTLGGTGWSSG